jgi:hypothetical protein
VSADETAARPDHRPGARRTDRRWLAVVAVPVCAYLTGIVALPRPHGVSAEQRGFDRASLGDAVFRTPTNPTRAVDVTLGEAVQVRGADLPAAALSRGGRLAVRLHLGVTATLADDWQVFVHIDADDGGFRVNGDHWPVRGRYQTTLWQPGEFIVDAFDVVVPTAAPAGTYTVWVGLYRGDKRLPVTGGDRRADDGENRVRVGTVVVE